MAPRAAAGSLSAACLAAVLMAAPPAMAWTERDGTAERNGTLHGTFTLPDDDWGAVPAVVIVAGSGPVDRDGNIPGLPNDSLKRLAHDLADRGIASVRADKRGIGASRWPGLQEQDLRFIDAVQDTVAWAAVLRAEPRVASIALLGHSEGALAVTLACAPAAADRIILVAGAGTPAGVLMERQFSEGGLPPDLRQALHRILTGLAAGEPAQDVPAPLATLFRPSVQPYLMSWLPLDPAAALARVTVPVLVVQGTTDIQIDPNHARILAAARPGARLALIDGMNHILRTAPADRAANIATYRDPALPLAPGLVPLLAEFLRP